MTTVQSSGRIKSGVSGAARSNGTWGAVIVALTVSILHLFGITLSADVGAQLVVISNSAAVLVGMVIRAARHGGTDL